MTSERRIVRVLGAQILACVALMGACGGTASSPTTQVGSESHFLAHCGVCADGLDCIGGICTRACLTSASGCSDLDSAASCTDQSVEPGEVAVCDVACSTPSDCLRLGSGYDCRGAFCRTGTASVPSNEPSVLERDVLCEPYLDRLPPPQEYGTSIVNQGTRVLYLQQFAVCGGVSSPSLVQVQRDGQTLNTLGGGCAMSCQEAFNVGWNPVFEAGQTTTDCPGIDCDPVPRLPIQPGETLFQPAGLEVVFQRMPQACAEGSLTDTVNCYARIVPPPQGNYSLTVLAFEEPDCGGITNCVPLGSCGNCPLPIQFSLTTDWPFHDLTLAVAASD